MSKPSVFISYSRPDRPAALKLCEDLEIAGFRPWVDTQLKPGQPWKDVIEKELRKCSFVLVLLSEHSLAKKGFFQRELRVALDEAQNRPPQRPFIIPVRIDNVSDDKFPELSYFIGRTAHAHTKRAKIRY